MDIWTLSPLIVKGQQYLFLRDIETLFNLREDEALGVLCGFDVDTSVEEPSMLGYSEQSLEEYLTTMLAIMKSTDTTIYDALSVAIPTPPPPSVEPHDRFQGSINIAQEEAMDCDQADMVSKFESFL